MIYQWLLGNRSSIVGRGSRRIHTSQHHAIERRAGRSLCQQALQHQWQHCFSSTYPHLLGTGKQAMRVQGELIIADIDQCLFTRAGDVPWGWAWR